MQSFYFLFLKAFVRHRVSKRNLHSRIVGNRLVSVLTSSTVCLWSSVFIGLSSSTGPPRMSPKSQRTPRAHRVPPCRTTGVPPGVDLISHNAPGEVPVTPPTRSSSSGGTWSSVVSGGRIVLSFLFYFFTLCEFLFWFIFDFIKVPYNGTYLQRR